MLLQPHIHDGIKQEVPVTFISYNFTGTQQAWSATERELYTIYMAMRKLSYMIKGSRVTIRTDHKQTNSSRNGQIPKFGSSRQISSLDQ